MSKKLIALLLTVLMIFSTSVTCFATNTQATTTSIVQIAEQKNFADAVNDATCLATTANHSTLETDSNEDSLLVRIFRWIWNFFFGWLIPDEPTPPDKPVEPEQPATKITRAQFNINGKENGYIPVGELEDIANVNLYLLVWYDNNTSRGFNQSQFTVLSMTYDENTDTFTIGVSIEDPNLGGIEYEVKNVKSAYEYDLTIDDTYELDKCVCATGNVVIPASVCGKPVTSIDYLAFEDLRNVRSIVVPSSVSYIDSAAFMYLPNLQAFDVSNDNLHYSDEDGILFNKDKTILIRCPEGKRNPELSTSDRAAIYFSYTVPSSVISIGERAFEDCKYLIEIIIPENVESIEEYAFYKATSLSSVTIFGRSTYIDGAKVFGMTSNNLIIRCHEGSEAEAYAQENNIFFDNYFEASPSTAFATATFSALDTVNHVVGTFDATIPEGTLMNQAYLVNLVIANGYPDCFHVLGSAVGSEAQAGQSYSFEAEMS